MNPSAATFVVVMVTAAAVIVPGMPKLPATVTRSVNSSRRTHPHGSDRVSVRRWGPTATNALVPGAAPTAGLVSSPGVSDASTTDANVTEWAT